MNENYKIMIETESNSFFPESEVQKEEDFFAGNDGLLIFDGYCGVCTRLAYYAERKVKKKTVTVMPHQVPGIYEKFDITKKEAEHAVWYIKKDEEGFKKYQGAEAVNEVMRTMDIGWRILSRAYTVPIIRRAQDKFYRKFADIHRSKFKGVTPACERRGNRCMPQPNPA